MCVAYSVILLLAWITYVAPIRQSSSCEVLIARIIRLTNATSSLIYQCRSGDNCGGVGDRLAGIMAGSYFAITVGRSFRIKWDSLSDVFEPATSTAQWTYDTYNAANIDGLDVNLNNFRVDEIMGFGRITVPSPKHPQVAVFNDMNSRQITNTSLWPSLVQYQHIFFHSNRGPDQISYQQLSKAVALPIPINSNKKLLHFEAYRCIFNQLFKPTESFLNSTYKPIGRPAMQFRKIVEIAQNPKFPSVAYHHRIPDKYVLNDDPRGVIDGDTLQWLAGLIQGETRTKTKRKPQTNLFFITNSPASAARVLATPSFVRNFRAIYIQELSGPTHINMAVPNRTDLTQNVHAKRTVSSGSAKQSFLQTMHDWYILKSVQKLVCGQSGFCRSAALVGSEQQLVYDSNSASFHLIGSVCTNRECI